MHIYTVLFIATPSILSSVASASPLAAQSATSLSPSAASSRVRVRRFTLPRKRYAPTSPAGYNTTAAASVSNATALRTVSSAQVLPLKRASAPSRSHSHMKAIRLDYGTETLSSSDSGQSFLTTVTFSAGSPAQKDFDVVVDTGSSDTWLASSNLTCVDPADRSTLAVEDCEFGPLYEASETLQPIEGLEFNITYGDGEFVNGFMALENVSLAGIDVAQQQIGVVEMAGWLGDGASSGLLGLAFPSLTSAFAEGNEDPEANVDYSPLFTSMHGLGLVDPIFSIALSRDESGKGNGGVLALGGIPEQEGVEGGYDETFACTDIEVLKMDIRGGGQEPGTAEMSETTEATEYTFYAITVDGLSYSAETDAAEPTETPEPTEPESPEDPCEPTEPVEPADATEPKDPADQAEGEGNAGEPCWLRDVRNRYANSRPKVSQIKRAVVPRHTYGGGIDPATENLQMIIDSGTTLNYVPTDAAANFNALWNPPAYTSDDPELRGRYLVDCNATAPSFDVMIEGETFSTNPKDLSLELTGDGTTCLSGVQDAGGNKGQSVFILGDVWLKNVLAVFDVGGGAIRVASRVEYES